MAEIWRITCKDCGDEFEYSDYVLQMEIKRGLSRPERCKDCRKTHSLEIQSVGNSHFELTPRQSSPSILGVPFLGMLDHQGRTIERKELPDESVVMDLGLKDKSEDTIKEIYREIDEHQIVIIVAATGTGKSTYFPFRLAFPLLYENNNDPNKYLKYGPIVVTQPRVMATEGIPAAIAKNLVVSKIGEGFEIGYKHGEKRQKTVNAFESEQNKTSKSGVGKKTKKVNRSHEDYSMRNRLIFVTDGSLLNWISQGKLGQFSAIIIDEAHERSTNIDLILALVKNELPKYPHLKLIILSATIDSQSFEDFFKSALPQDSIKVLNYTSEKYSIKRYKYEEVDWKWLELSAEEVAHQANERDIFESNKKLKEFVKTAPIVAANKVIELLEDKNGKGGILVFLPGVREMKECFEYIRSKYKIDETIKLFELHSLLPDEIRDKAAEPFTEKDKVTVNGEKVFPRRVVIATNIAETSITFDDIVHVIDSGLINQSHWDPNACVQNVRPQFHSKDGCKQRWGRTGRKCDGFVYKLYPKDWFVRFFPHHTSPEIERTCLDEVFLTAIENGATDVSRLTWLTRPNPVEFNRVDNLVSARRFVDEDKDITELGREVLTLRKSVGRIIDQFGKSSAAFSLDMASLMVKADKFGCLIEAATLAAAIPQLGASTYIAEDKIEKDYNGFFLWNNEWDLITKDFVGRLHRHLRAGCADDLDLVFKLSVIFDIQLSKETKLFDDIFDTHFVCKPNIFKYLKGRESLLQSFLKGKKDESIRSAEFKLFQKLRLLIPLAMPDKLGEISSKNGQLFFVNNKGAKYLLSPNLTGSWNDGDRAIALNYGQSSYIVEKQPNVLLKDTPTAPYAEFLVKVNDVEFLQEANITDYQILQKLKEFTAESEAEEETIKNMFVSMLAPIGSTVTNVESNNTFQISEVILNPFRVSYEKVELEEEPPIDELEDEHLIDKKDEKLILKVTINQNIRRLLENTYEIQVSSNYLPQAYKLIVEKYEWEGRKVVAFLSDSIYYTKATNPEIMQKEFVEVVVEREIVNPLSKSRIGYLCKHKRQEFPVPIESINIDPFIPFQKSIVGQSIFLHNFKIKSLPFYYGLTVLPVAEAELKSAIAVENVFLQLLAIKNDRNFGARAYFKIQQDAHFPVYISSKFTESYDFENPIKVLLSFNIEREKVISKRIGGPVELNEQKINQVLKRNNFSLEDGSLSHKDLRSIKQFIDLFDDFYSSTQSYGLYRSIRKLYTQTFRVEIQMETVFDKILIQAYELINKLGEITESDRTAFQSEIKDFQAMFRVMRPQLESSFEKIDDIVSAMWNLDASEVSYKKLTSDMSNLLRQLNKVDKDKDKEKYLNLADRKNKVEKQLKLLQQKRSGYFDSYESCKNFIIKQFNLPTNYSVKIVGTGENFQTLQSAVNAAANGDLILIKDGLYNECVTINKDVTLRSANSNAEKIIIQSDSRHTILVQSGRVCLSRLTIRQDGIEDENENMHTAVFNNSDSLLIDNCDVTSASNVSIENEGNLFIYQSTVTGNRKEGAGIYNAEDSSVNILKSNIKNCSEAIYSINSREILVSRSSVEANTGITLDGHKPTLLSPDLRIDNTWNCNRITSGNALRIKR